MGWNTPMDVTDRMIDEASPDYWDEPDDEDSDPMDELQEECGLDDEGQCALAGTEHCDFVCPWRDSEDFAGSAAWQEKHR